ncbi:hypothetical protein SIID45300_01087 [Candidatus Magnetaquicoccaceae bacterium FCR-1]|uniref:Phage protein n=1 Tax=Candidatus Magnetaquiglobus chichijimensis TaxID=3141448 RepID=A0ABQ0C7A9_9PROT
MESIEVAKIKPGQSITLEFGNKSPILTRLDESRKFTLEDWYPEACEIYVLDEEIAEDEPVRYAFDPELTLDDLDEDQKRFGEGRRIFDFLGRVVGSIEGDEDEEDDEEEDGEGDGDEE